MSSSLRLIVMICLTIFACVDISSGDSVIVVLVGSNATLSCQVANNTFVRWIFVAISSSIHPAADLLIYNGMKLSDSAPTGLQVTDCRYDGNVASNLTVIDVNMNHAGEYTCVGTMDDREMTVFQLNVIGPGSSCRNSHNSTLEEFVGVEISCDVRHRGSLQPVIRCLVTNDVTEQRVEYAALVAADTYAVKTNVTRWMHGHHFKCTVQLAERASDDSTSERVYSISTWQSQPINVTYGPEGISSRRDGRLLTCQADGNPRPTFGWTELGVSGGAAMRDGQSLDLCDTSRVRRLMKQMIVDVADQEMSFRCVVRRDEHHVIDTTFSFIAVPTGLRELCGTHSVQPDETGSHHSDADLMETASKPSAASTDTAGDGSASLVIVGAIAISAVIIAGLVIVAILTRACRKRHRKRRNSAGTIKMTPRPSNDNRRPSSCRVPLFRDRSSGVYDEVDDVEPPTPPCPRQTSHYLDVFDDYEEPATTIVGYEDLSSTTHQPHKIQLEYSTLVSEKRQAETTTWETSAAAVAGASHQDATSPYGSSRNASPYLVGALTYNEAEDGDEEFESPKSVSDETTTNAPLE